MRRNRRKIQNVVGRRPPKDISSPPPRLEKKGNPRQMIIHRWLKKILRQIPAQAGRPGIPDPDLLPENLMANLWPGWPSWDPDSDFLIPALFALERFIPVRGWPIPIESHNSCKTSFVKAPLFNHRFAHNWNSITNSYTCIHLCF